MGLRVTLHPKIWAGKAGNQKGGVSADAAGVKSDATYEIIKYAHGEGVKVVVNTAPYLPIDEKIFQYIDIVTPNEIEAECFTGVKVADEASALQAAGIFRERV